MLERLWEQYMIDRGVQKYLEGIDRAKMRVSKEGKRSVAKDEASTSYGVTIMRDIFSAYEECVEWHLRTGLSRAGRPTVALTYIAAGDLREVAYISAKCIIDSISRTEGQTSLAYRIAGQLEDHMRVCAFDNSHPKYYKSVIEDMKKRRVNDYRTKRKTLVACHNKAIAASRAEGADIPKWIPWPQAHKALIGLHMVDMFILAGSDWSNGESGVNNCYQNAGRIVGSGFIERVKTVTAGKTQYYVQGTDKAAAWIQANMEICQYLHPEYLPTLVEPRDWTDPYDGGYHTKRMRDRKPLVKSSRKHLAVLEKVFMPKVYKAVNAAQQTPWQVNDFVLNAAVAEYYAPSGIGMPGQEKIVPPPCPLEPWEQGDMSPKAFRAYRKQMRAQLTPDEKAEYARWAEVARDCYNRENERISKLIGLNSTLKVANMLAEKDEFYYVHTLDYRGRLYPCGTGLNPQGTDMSKALLRFKRGTILGKHGFWHLCIHSAGVYGVDKVSLEDRVQWVLSHKREIIRTGLDPDDAREFWKEADKPYMFLAACQELADIFLSHPVDVNNCLQSGLEWTASSYSSHVACAQDGSCNGIQHFSAMLLDPVGARAVNMTNTFRVEDIYQETADKVIEDIREDLLKGKVLDGKELRLVMPAEATVMQIALERLQINRKTTKRSTMIIPYGGTKRSCLTHVKDWVVEKVDELADKGYGRVLDDKQTYLCALRLHHYVWHALDTIVVAARKAMKFLRAVVKVNSKHQMPLQWQTPTGFVARQEIKEVRHKRVNTHLAGRMQVHYTEETDRINGQKMATSFPPNYVHSMDSAHLMLVVCDAMETGVEDFALVHDSYGVPAGWCQDFHVNIRQRFYEIYRNHVLENLRNQQIAMFPEFRAEYPDPSDVARGAYDLKEVLNATYFFR